MLGYTEAELLSMSVMDIHPRDCVPKVMQILHARVVEGYRGDVDIPVVRKDGSILYVNIIGNPFIYRGRQCIAGFFRDITERKHAHEALLREHRTLKHLLQSGDHERQLIAYEIHDGLAQQLAGAIMQFQTFHFLKEAKPKEAAKAYDAGMTMLQQGHFEARRLISGVRPPILDEEGVVAAVAHLVNEQNRLKGPKAEYYSSVVFDRLSPTLENAIYRITQEALTNACQHSVSRKVRVSLSQRDDRVRIDIRDWGIGFDRKAVQENRFGLEGIRQRVRLLGGRCRIRSKVGKGTRIIVELPVVERE
jgi:signal transduction histidine kinase